MTKDAPGSDDDAVAFAEAVRGVRTLGGARRISPGIGIADFPAVHTPPRLQRTTSPAVVALAVEDGGDSWTARADGVDRRILRKLRDGQIQPESQIDLHGLNRVKAADALDRFVTASRAADRRCLLVIHGRGLHSGQDGPALGDVVRGLLTTGPHAGVVLACTSASPSHGGAGATMVYLRR